MQALVEGSAEPNCTLTRLEAEVALVQRKAHVHVQIIICRPLSKRECTVLSGALHLQLAMHCTGGAERHAHVPACARGAPNKAPGAGSGKRGSAHLQEGSGHRVDVLNSAPHSLGGF